MADDTDKLGTALLSRARWAIEEALGVATCEPPPHPAFAERRASFVTLTLGGELRGCIGSINAQRDLGSDVADNAVGAALRDSRFSPLTADELAQVHIDVSVLTSPDFIEVRDEADALQKIRPGIDGVIFFNGCRKSTFLPQVWEQLPEPAAFLARLKEKAGMPADFWGPSVMLATYQVEKFTESG